MSHTLHYCRSIFKAKIKSRSKVLILVSIKGTCIRFSKGNHQSQAWSLLRPPWNSADNPHWWYRWYVIQIQIQIQGPDNSHLVTNTNTRRSPDYSVEAVFPATTVVRTRSLAREDLRDLRFISCFLLKNFLFAITSGNFWHSHLFFCGNCLLKLFDTILHVRSLTRTYDKMMQIVLMTLWLYVRVITLFRNRKMVVSALSFWVSIKLFTLSRHCT